MPDHLVITREPLDRALLHSFLASPDCGAEVTFAGVVRCANLGRTVVAIDYDFFEELAANQLREIASEARESWGATLRIFVAHRVGRIAAGECSVLIGAASPHRDEAFKACRFVIEQVKHRLAIWKREMYLDGQSAWLPGCSLCRASLPTEAQINQRVQQDRS